MGGRCWTSSDRPGAVHHTHTSMSTSGHLPVSPAELRRGEHCRSPLSSGPWTDWELLDFVADELELRTSTRGCGVRPQDHQNSSSIIPRNAQQVQGPCGVDPGPPGGSQAGSGGWNKKCINAVLLKRDKPIFLDRNLQIPVEKI